MEFNNKEEPAIALGGERRGYKRYITDFLLQFWYSEEIDTWKKGRVVDFSLEGLQLETSAELQPDSTILFDFAPLLRNIIDSPLITGHVKWGTKIGEKFYQYGVYFLTAESQYDGILEDDDRDRNILVEVLANLIMGGRATPKKT